MAYERATDKTVDGENDQFTVVTSFYPMYIAALNITDGVDGVKLENLSEPQTGCLHDFQLTPEDMKLLSTADMFIINGGGIESFMSDVAAAYPKLDVVEACADVSLLAEDDELEDDHDHDHDADTEEADDHNHDHDADTEEADDHDHDHDADTEEADDHNHDHDADTEEADDHDHDHDADIEETEGHYHDHDADSEETDGHNHDHGDENAHAWMSVSRYRTMVSTIAEELAKADPAHADQYTANAKEYDGKLAELEEEQQSLKELTAGKDIIIFHEAYAYVADDLGMNVCYLMDLDEERSVSAGEVRDVINAINNDGVSVILAEELYGKDMGDTVSRETDVNVVYIDPLNRGNYDKDSYIDGMEKNIELIRNAFSK